MKRLFILSIALAAVAIGCTKSEVIKAPGRGREVKFDTYVGKTPVTKAESADLDYLKQSLTDDEGGFQVYGFLHDYVEPTVQAPVEGEEIYNGTDMDVDVSGIATNSAYMDKQVNWVAGEGDVAGYWDYPGVVYWPDYSTSRKLAFAAWALNVKDLIEWEEDPNVAGNDKTDHPAGQSYTKFSYTVPSAVKDQKDLMVTPFVPNQGLDASANASPVQLNFKHLLSRVGFQVVANQDGDVVIDIKDITLYGKFPKTGNVDLKGKGVIDPVTETEGGVCEESYTFFQSKSHYFSTTSSKTATNIFENRLIITDTEIVPGEENQGETKITIDTLTNDSNRYMMIMPSTQARNADADGNFSEDVLPGAYIDVVYQLTDADEHTARVSLDGWEFKPGVSYTFIFKVSTSSIEFEVSVEEWTEHFAASDETDADGKPIYPNGNGIYTLIPFM